MAIPAGAKAFNLIRENASEVYMNIVPSATESNIGELANILFNDAYEPQLNEFVHNLINRIGLTIIENKSYSNQLSLLKKGTAPLGTDIQSIYTNPAEAEQYGLTNTDMAKLLTITDPDTKVAYYRRNRKDLYTVTIARETLQGAFVSWKKFEDFIASITNSLYSGNYIDEFKYTKALVRGAYENSKVIVKTVSAITTQASARAFIKEVRKIYNMMQFPSSDYNAYSQNTGDNKPVVTWTDASRVVFLVRADVMAECDVEVMANAFNLSKTDFLGRVITVDTFGNDNILGLIADESFFQIYDNIFKFTQFDNARTLSWNYYLHAWQTFAISPFANAVVLATAQPTPATKSISWGVKSAEIAQNDHEGFDMTVLPTTAEPEVTAAVVSVPDLGSSSDITLQVTSTDGYHIDVAVASDAVAGEYIIRATATDGDATLTDDIKIVVTE